MLLWLHFIIFLDNEFIWIGSPFAETLPRSDPLARPPRATNPLPAQARGEWLRFRLSGCLYLPTSSNCRFLTQWIKTNRWKEGRICRCTKIVINLVIQMANFFIYIFGICFLYIPDFLDFIIFNSIFLFFSSYFAQTRPHFHAPKNTVWVLFVEFPSPTFRWN